MHAPMLVLGFNLLMLNVNAIAADELELPVTTPGPINSTEDDNGAIGGSVSRIAFTRAVVKSEPVDRIAQLSTDKQHIYFFSELKGFTGETIIHRWEYNGQIVAEYPFAVGGPRWRVWSSQILLPEQKGKWSVSILDQRGRIIREGDFQYSDSGSAQNIP